MNRLHRIFKGALASAVLILVAGCSSFTSIDREPSGDFVITGWTAPGPRGFVWICKYDPATRTLTVKEELPK